MTNKITLKDARLSVGLSQERFAQEIGMNVSTYIKKEQYKRDLLAKELITISQKTGIPCERILLKSEK